MRCFCPFFVFGFPHLAALIDTVQCPLTCLRLTLVARAIPCAQVGSPATGQQKRDQLELPKIFPQSCPAVPKLSSSAFPVILRAIIASHIWGRNLCSCACKNSTQRLINTSNCNNMPPQPFRISISIHHEVRILMDSMGIAVPCRKATPATLATQATQAQKHLLEGPVMRNEHSPFVLLRGPQRNHKLPPI